ncbi:NADH dehydrogenase [ubiquinone] 1 alpha subcomplex assembly factor 3 [Bienertia sinuspersici]
MGTNIIDALPSPRLIKPSRKEVPFLYSVQRIPYWCFLVSVLCKVYCRLICIIFIVLSKLMLAVPHIEPVNSEIRSYVRSVGMKLEVVDSRNAASTYNILNEEGRIIAAGLLPYGASS